MNGGCLCGAVRFEVTGELGRIGHCHCKMCQRSHGAAFGTYAHVPNDKFRFTSGEKLVKRYASSEGVTRTFCSECGSALQFLVSGRDHLSVTAGCFDDNVRAPVDYELWTSSAAPWGTREGVPFTHDTEPL